MTVYVDNASIQYGRMLMSHIAADSLDELHEMARLIGLKKEWFQNGRLPHYDVSQSRKTRAIALGAVEVSSKDLVHVAKRMPNLP